LGQSFGFSGGSESSAALGLTRPQGTRTSSVGLHSSAAFDVPVGTHTITCADSPHPTDNPGSVTEFFESGFTYTYEILGQ
jgi:hypothetical protein